MKKTIILCLIPILLLITAGVFPAELKARTDRGKIQVITDVLNVRADPDLNAPIVSEISYGENYSITAEQGDWIQISLGNSSGWVAGWLVSRNKKTESSESLSSLKESELPASVTAVVSADTLRIRNGPGKQFQVIGSLTEGKEAEILEKNENWVKIQTDEIIGWAAAEFLTKSEADEKEKKPKTKKTKKANLKIAVVRADQVNVRETPSKDGSILGKVNKGTSLPIEGNDGDWIKVNYQRGTGWIHSAFAEVNSFADTDSPTSNESQDTIATITAERLVIRDTPSLNGKVVDTAANGNQYTILDEKNSWVKIRLQPGKTGWAAGWYIEKNSSNEQQSAKKVIKGNKIKILYNGTSLREKADANSNVIKRAEEGEIYTALSIKNDWYQIKRNNSQTAWVAGWMVSIDGFGPQVKKPGADLHLKNKTIIIDPGHGGRDNGTTGLKGNLEKNITLRTASLLYDKLKAAGANAILTRSTDTYISLESRVSISHRYSADAFISIHYDGSPEDNANGFTSYYLHGYQETLAQELHYSLSQYVKLKDRGVREGDYHVLRENKRSAALLELGYLSNPAEEETIVSGRYQEAAATGIFNGLAHYFKDE
ncbi:SH3 domain-containing protein [Peribacillus deserti]|uniref:N-acetylmuramoyl-L-alanine amidase n=1 Tax=Peribacillus deserti TaxID=673318 RepID=A0A2N5M957_9BACI|nr:SH3 domain-containing protein [Peribacillus deserti]PLT30887.1 N-acetylmuramoyl-L-alanine amidase [Peribacillus deserti]